MNTITKDQLRSLVTTNIQGAVSIYLPTHPVGQEMRQDPIRLKNLLREAEQKLADCEISESDTKHMLKQAYELIDDVDFWEHQKNNGLAMFISKDEFQIYKLPIEFTEKVSVSDHYSIKQLLPYFSNNGKFFILSLSQDRVKLLECSPYNCSEIKLDGIPESIQVIMDRYQPEPSLQVRGAGNRAGGDSGRSAYHGNADLDDIIKVRIKEYLNEISKGIEKQFSEETSPMILATVDYYLPMFKEVSSYKNIVDKCIEGNPDSLDDNTLHKKALEIVEPILSKNQNEAIEKYTSIKNTSDTSHQLDDIVASSFQGRIQTLFVDIDTEVFGEYVIEENKVNIKTSYEPGTRDLLDFAAAQTIFNNGEVFALKTDRMPDEYICAVYRF